MSTVILKSSRIYFGGRSLYNSWNALRHGSSVPVVPVKLPLFWRAFKKETRDRIAFIDHTGQTSTFGELGKKSLYLSMELKQLVGGQEERIAFLCDRDSSFPITLGAIWWAQHVAIPLSPSHPENILEHFLKTTSSKLVVTSKKYADHLRKVTEASGAKLLVVDYDDLTTEEDHYESMLNPNIYDERGALILFTSGTTGKPKGVLLSHSNLLAQVENIYDAWGLTYKDTMLHVVPLHHVHGLIHALLCPLASGARCQILEKFDAEKTWQELLSDKELRPSVFTAVPTVYVRLIEEFERTFGRDPSKAAFVREMCRRKIRVFLSGSASLPVPILNKFEDITGHRIMERYGMTETGLIFSNPLRGQRRPGFVGRPLQSVEVMITNFKSRTEYDILATGNCEGVDITANGQNEKSLAGTLLVRGPSVFKEYFGNPEATEKEHTEDGWFITGDTVEFTNGSFKVLGRNSVDIIKSGGYKLSALEIETQLLALQEIKEIAVLGIPDSTWGQRVAAVVVWNGKELALNELREIAKTRLTSYSAPSVIKSLTELPKNHLGKVNKKELAKLFA